MFERRKTEKREKSISFSCLPLMSLCSPSSSLPLLFFLFKSDPRQPLHVWMYICEGNLAHKWNNNTTTTTKNTTTTAINIGLTRPAPACVVVCKLHNWLNTFIRCLVRPISSDVATFWENLLLQKVRSLPPYVVANGCLAFIWRFWKIGFFLSGDLSVYVNIGLVLL